MRYQKNEHVYYSTDVLIFKKYIFKQKKTCTDGVQVVGKQFEVCLE